MVMITKRGGWRHTCFRINPTVSVHSLRTGRIARGHAISTSRSTSPTLYTTTAFACGTLDLVVMFAFVTFAAALALARADDIWQNNPIFYPKDACTAIAVGPSATADGSVMVTHNNDCQECDIRLTHVPARDWPKGSKRPVFAERTSYPRFLQSEKYNVHGEDYLVENVDSTIYPWKEQQPIFFIDQVEHTYAYTMGTYPLQNEKQLSFGESTCETTLWSTPSWMGGKASFNIRALMEVALERCDTSRCAIALMGDLAEKHGFYCFEGAATTHAGCSEALTIADPKEAWMFHITADDTHVSAVWVAQRVPDNHISAVANQFVIREINVKDKKNFMASSNIFEVAKRAGLWDPNTPFDYLKAYGKSYGTQGHAATRRVWRVFSLADPDVPLSPFTDDYGNFGYGKHGADRYPFSVEPQKPLTLQNIMTMARDNYEGTPFSLMDGPDSGPWGDVIRSGPMSRWEDPVNGLNFSEFAGLGMNSRAISIWRTAYSSICQARSYLPDEVGAVTWVAPNAPHHATYVPIYAAAADTPSTMNHVTQYKLDRTKSYWAHSVTGNYLSRWFKWTYDDVKAHQMSLEEEIFSKQSKMEGKAVKALEKGDVDDAMGYLLEFHEVMGKRIVDAWWDFFWEMTAKYRDIYKITRPHAENFLNAPDFIGYDRSYAEFVGYWKAPGAASPGRKPMGVAPMVFDTKSSVEEYEKAYPEGGKTRFYLHANFQQTEANIVPEEPVASSGYGLVLLGVIIGFAAAVLSNYVYQNYWAKSQQGYSRINERDGAQML